jgi:hypothetical protein
MVLKKGTENISYDRKYSGRRPKLLSPVYKSNLYCSNQIVAGESEMLNEWEILRILQLYVS